MPCASSGKVAGVLADNFLARSGVTADEALHRKVEAFIAERGLTPRTLDMIPDARLRAYAGHLRDDLPIAYDGLAEGLAVPLRGKAPDGLLRLGAMLPNGPLCTSMTADFERGLLYCDPALPVFGDVCRARYAGPMDANARDELLEILAHAPMDAWRPEYIGNAALAHWPAMLAMEFDYGVVRFSALGADSGAPQAFVDTLTELLDAALRRWS